MKLYFIEQDDLDIIKTNLPTWAANFKDSSPDWLVEWFKNEYDTCLLKESKYTIDDFQLDMSKDKEEQKADARETKYRLKDNYSRFYLRHIEPRKEIIDSGASRFVSLEALEGWDAIMGLQFENLVLNHYADLIDPLHIGNSLIESAAPYSRQRKHDGKDGLQIDLLLQTRHSNYVVEIKRKREIGREVIDEVERKIAKLSTPRGKSARPVLVYDGILAPIVETDGYFDAIVPFTQLLGL